MSGGNDTLGAWYSQNRKVGPDNSPGPQGLQRAASAKAGLHRVGSGNVHHSNYIGQERVPFPHQQAPLYAVILFERTFNTKFVFKHIIISSPK